MKKFGIILGALALGGCVPAAIVSAVNTASTIATQIQTQGNVVVVKGTQALLVAEYAYNAIGESIIPLLTNGTITGANATRVREINRVADSWLERGFNARTDAEKALAAAEVMKAVAELSVFKKGER